MNGSHMSKRAFEWSFIINIVLCTVLFSIAPLAIAQTTSSAKQCPNSEYLTGAVLWTQSSAEYRALAYQTFTLARLRLDQDLRSYGAKRGPLRLPAVIVDVDEMVLDNTRY